MRKSELILLFSIAVWFPISTTAQSILLTFDALYNTTYTELDSVKIMNLTQGGDTVLHWPNLKLELGTLTNVTNANPEKGGFGVFQNYPNPVIDQTTISVFVPEKRNVDFRIQDISGREIIKTGFVLDKGFHSFRFTPGNSDVYIFSARWNGYASSLKILNATSVINNDVLLEYLGCKLSETSYKAMNDLQSFSFTLGDELLYIGCTDIFQSGLYNIPEVSENFTFQFAHGVPCPDHSTVTYEGKVYSTIQIFGQCWFQENLNVGTMILSSQQMTDNDTIEKYCYDNNSANCSEYGGLYRWNELMAYSTQESAQGICPPDWHVPSDLDWKILNGAVDSLFRIGDVEWDLSWEYHGYNAGKKLKSSSGWDFEGNGTNDYGFSGLPGGSTNTLDSFYDIGTDARWWCSTKETNNKVWTHQFHYFYSGVYRSDIIDSASLSVRCVHD